MDQKPNLRNNVGWQKWNMSKRISSANLIAQVARKHLESCLQTRYWSANDVAELQRLTEAMEDCAVRANETWSNLSNTPSEGAVAVSSDDHPGSGGDHEVLDRTREIYRAGNVTEYWDYVDDFKRLMIRVEWEGNRHRWNVIGRVQRPRGKIKIIAPVEVSPSSDTPTAPPPYTAELAKRYALLPEEADELYRLTSLFDACATEARTTFAVVSDFLEEIDPDGRGATLWSVPRSLEERMLTIRSTDTVVEDSLKIEAAISALLETASRRSAKRTD